MNESAASTQLERELSELRARAYGPHPDIQDDPEALARLDELESARLREQAPHEPVQVIPETVVVDEVPPPAAMGVEPGRPASVWQKATGRSTGRIWLVVGAVAVVLGAWFAASWFAAPSYEETLQPRGVAADAVTRGAVSRAPLAEVDMSTLRGYEPYRRLTPWIADGAKGSRCLIVVQASTLWGIRCAPPQAALMVDIGAFPPSFAGAYAEGLADGTVIRFELRGDSIDVSLYPPPSAD